MYILGDIGNSETKIFIVSSNYKIIKKVNFTSKDINLIKLNKFFDKLKLDYKKIKKILFCSVVPKSFELIKKYLLKKTRIKCYEVKNLNLKSLIKIKVNYKQVGSDRITNAISLLDKKNNFIILDFGTATTFDVLIKDSYAGGVIAPGVRLSLDTLSDKATLIPRIDLKKIKNIVVIRVIQVKIIHHLIKELLILRVIALQMILAKPKTVYTNTLIQHMVQVL